MKYACLSFEKYPNGGAACNRHLAYLEALADRGHTITLFTTQSVDGPVSDKITVRSLARGQSAGLKAYLSHFVAIFRLAIDSRQRSDVIFYLGTSGILALPVFVWKLLSSAVLLHERTELPRLMVGRSLLSQLDYTLYSRTLKLYDRLFVITHALRQAMAEYPGVYLSKIEVINMIVDFARFGERSSPPSPTLRNIVFCGDMSSGKDGIDILVQAFIRFCERNRTAKLTMVGDCTSHYFKNAVAPLIADSCLKERILLTGFVNRDRVPALLTEADVLVLSRPDSEQARYGFPTKLGEYLATGRPVVVTDTGEIARFLKDKESAYVCAPNSVEAFADRLCQIDDDLASAAAIGKKGYIVAKQHFTAERVASAIESATLSALDERRSA